MRFDLMILRIQMITRWFYRMPQPIETGSVLEKLMFNNSCDVYFITLSFLLSTIYYPRQLLND